MLPDIFRATVANTIVPGASKQTCKQYAANLSAAHNSDRHHPVFVERGGWQAAVIQVCRSIGCKALSCPVTVFAADTDPDTGIFIARVSPAEAACPVEYPDMRLSGTLCLQDLSARVRMPNGLEVTCRVGRIVVS